MSKNGHVDDIGQLEFPVEEIEIIRSLEAIKILTDPSIRKEYKRFLLEYYSLPFQLIAENHGFSSDEGFMKGFTSLGLLAMQKGESACKSLWDSVLEILDQ